MASAFTAHLKLTTLNDKLTDVNDMVEFFIENINPELIFYGILPPRNV